MIDQITVGRIIDAAQIVDVVSDFVNLKKRGANYVGLCPFHDDKTPSFYVSPAKGLCKCFSCGKGGNPIHFIMEKEQLNYYEALKHLAKKYNIEVVEREFTNKEKEVQSERESMFLVNNFAVEYFQDILNNNPNGRNIGLAYFRQRGFRDDIIKKFQLGYCLDSKDEMYKEALKKGYQADFLIKTGLCYENDYKQIRDRFWGRVIFPVHSISGKIVAFGGRVLSTETKGIKVKYVNSPDSLIYHKSKELYGLYLGKNAIVKNDKCFLVEGYTDVISMHQSGIENVVASSGTALTTQQINLIHRFTNNITLLFDGDTAGIKASLKGIDLLLAEGMNIKVCLFPDGEDPDSFARKNNATQFQTFIEKNEVDFLRFKTNLLLTEAGNDPMKRAELVNSIVQSIALIPEAIVRDIYIKESGQLLKLEDKLLVSEVAKQRQAIAEKAMKPLIHQSETTANTTNANVSSPPQATSSYQSSIPEHNQEGQEFYQFERLIIQVIVRYGEKVMCELEDENGESIPIKVITYIDQDLKQDEIMFHNSIHRCILEEAVKHLDDNDFVAERFFINHPDNLISRIASELANDRYQLSKFHSKTQKIISDEERLVELVPLLMTNFKNAIVTEEMKHIMLKLQDANIANNEDECNSLMKRYEELREIKSEMAKHLGDRVVLR